MIVFQEDFEQAEDLESKLREQIELLRALANFSVEEIDSEELANQRRQMVRSIKRLQAKFAKLMDKWHSAVGELKSQISYDPGTDDHSDLISKFIRVAVPQEMQSAWRPVDFTGSLLIFFVDGKIDSSSLVEKKARPLPVEHEHANNHSLETRDEEENKIVDIRMEPKESFSILKSPIDAKINIYFSLPEPANVIVRILNAKERPVRIFEKTYDEPGDYSVVWSGDDDEGERLPKDTYYCQLQIGSALSELKTIELS